MSEELHILSCMFICFFAVFIFLSIFVLGRIYYRIESLEEKIDEINERVEFYGIGTEDIKSFIGKPSPVTSESSRDLLPYLKCCTCSECHQHT